METGASRPRGCDRRSGQFMPTRRPSRPPASFARPTCAKVGGPTPWPALRNGSPMKSDASLAARDDGPPQPRQPSQSAAPDPQQRRHARPMAPGRRGEQRRKRQQRATIEAGRWSIRRYVRCLGRLRTVLRCFGPPAFARAEPRSSPDGGRPPAVAIDGATCRLSSCFGAMRLGAPPH